MAHHHTHTASEKRIFTAFLLNLAFAGLETVGALFSGSIAILSDALHDACDALGLFFSYFCEKKSRRKADSVYTYGYARYSILSTLFMTLILLFGSLIIGYHGILRLFSPTPVKSTWMLCFAALGFVPNLIAARVMHGGHSLNERAVTLHLLEDVAGWGLVLLASVIIHLTGFHALDAILSLVSSLVIAVFAVRTLLEALHILLEKAPKGLDTSALKAELLQTGGVNEIPHAHFWALDEATLCAAITLVVSSDGKNAKAQAKEILKAHGFTFVTVETETINESKARLKEASPPIEIAEKPYTPAP